MSNSLATGPVFEANDAFAEHLLGLGYTEVTSPKNQLKGKRPQHNPPSPANYKAHPAEEQARWSEDRLQQEFFTWMRHHLPEEERHLLAIPNGGLRTKVTASILLATGLKAGYPDTALDIARGGYHGLRIELKTISGRVQPNQTEWHERLRAQGYRVAVAWDLDECISTITGYLALPA